MSLAQFNGMESQELSRYRGSKVYDRWCCDGQVLSMHGSISLG